VWFVHTARDVRAARVAARGWADSELARREAAQMPLDAKRGLATREIINDGDEAALEARVRGALAAELMAVGME
jgi:dephospho-CoA kinase